MVRCYSTFRYNLLPGWTISSPVAGPAYFCEDAMAIDKSVENEYGAEFTYHKLREVRIINDDNIGVQLTLTVQSWLNKQARIDGKMPTVRQCIISNADFAMTPFYALLKAKFPEFSHGEDDFDNSFKVPEGGTESSGDVEYTTQTAQGRLISRRKESAGDDAVNSEIEGD